MPMVPGVLEDRWKGVQQSSLSRCIALESMESSLAHFTESAHFLATWLKQKEKMLDALGPIAIEPSMVKSQLHQVQVRYPSFLPASISVTLLRP